MLDQALRVSGIGGSEIAAVLGIDDWRDPFSIWAQKRGHLTPAPPTPQMLLGKLFEEAIVTRWYAGVTGYRVEWVDKTFVVEGRPWHIYTPDALCPDEARGVDAKLIFWDRSGEWGDETDEIPARVDLQCRWYMAATDYPLWDVAAVINGEPRIYTVRRDLELEAEILRRAEEFWRRYLIGDEQPPIGISDDSARYLKERYRWHSERLKTATEEEEALLQEYAQIRAEERQVQEAKTLCENQIKQAIGENSGIQCPGMRFTWKRTRDSHIPDWEVIARTLMRDWEEERQKTLIEEYSHLKPGYRRVYFVSNGKEDRL
jgi:predicted phage-related endonuclease